VTFWGSGAPRRELLRVDDLAAAGLAMPDRYSDEKPMIVGLGEDVSIRNLATLIAGVTGCRCRIEWDAMRPDGAPRKLLDVSRLRSLGWAPARTLREGLEDTLRWYAAHRTPPAMASARRAVVS
jgi:GDP-L-fucose synthase